MKQTYTSSFMADFVFCFAEGAVSNGEMFNEKLTLIQLHFWSSE